MSDSTWIMFGGLLMAGIAMIGSDSQTGSERFTFGHIHLYDGIDFLIAIVGLFAISEVLIFIEHHQGGAARVPS